MPQSHKTEPTSNNASGYALGNASDIAIADDINVDEVCDWVIKHCRADAEAALRSGRETVEILRSLGMDAPGLLAGLLQSQLPIDENEQGLMATRFGAVTMQLLHGAARMRQLSTLSQQRNEHTNSPSNSPANPHGNEENLRKMLIAMVDDIRVVLIELARHLSVLRHCREAVRDKPSNLTELAELGRITMEVYAPLANRLGIGQIKWQMEDYALRYLQPDDYRALAIALDEKRVAREQYIAEFIITVQSTLAEAGVAGEVYGRPKHLQSIWKKMRTKGLAFENLRDIRALRILLDSEADCYVALAAIHAHWQPLPGEFDDYIATPKDNGYRSIHSVIAGPANKTVEVQIRTHAMHQQSEFGVAAHWRYKEKVRADDNIDNKVMRLRQLLEWKEELRDVGAFAEQPLADQRIYVFTPKGTVIDLPSGSTPIDFAYAIHSELGNRIRGAQVNGKMSPLGRPLETGQQVHIQTVQDGHPSRDWLRNDLNFVRTRRARNRIAHWFKRVDYAQHLADGRSMLERELTRLGLEALSYDKIARTTHFHKTNDMLAAIGANDFKLSRALAPHRRRAESESESNTGHPPRKLSRVSPPDARHNSGHPDNFSVSGVGNLLTRMARCCNPIPGDPIVGFITAGRGISIHRRNCHNITSLDAPRRARLSEAQWGKSTPTCLPVDINITAYHRNGLLNDITEFLKGEKTEVLKLTMETDPEHGAYIRLKLEISGLKKLEQIMQGLSRIPDVRVVRRSAQ